MTNPGVIFFLSSGRCGTQWLASTLANAGSGVAVVAHEPIGSRYRSAEIYRQDVNKLNDEIATHIGNIATLRAGGQTYVETGWPSYGAIPHMIDRFGDDLALVHLTRHPVTTSLSLATTIWNWSTPGWDANKWTKLSLPHPAHCNVIQPGYERLFDHMTPFEQCLFWWTELNDYTHELMSRHPQVPTLRVRAEDLFARDRRAFEALLSFVGIALSDEALRSDAVDNFRGSAPDLGDPSAIAGHPTAIATAKRLGYDPLAWNGEHH